MEAVRKLTRLPVRLVINTEVHPDHTTGNFVFSPPALVINHEGASEAMRKAYDPERASALAKESADMRDAVQGYRLVTPHEYPALTQSILLESVEIVAYKVPEGPDGPEVFTGRTAVYAVASQNTGTA